MKREEEKANRAIVDLKEIRDLQHELREDATKTMTYFKKIQQLHIEQIKRLEILIDKMEIIKNNSGGDGLSE